MARRGHEFVDTYDGANLSSVSSACLARHIEAIARRWLSSSFDSMDFPTKNSPD